MIALFNRNRLAKFNYGSWMDILEGDV